MLHEGYESRVAVARARLRARLATPLLQLRAATRGPLCDRRLAIDRGAEWIEFATETGRASGRLYRAVGSENEPGPGLVLVHGSHFPGSGLALYRLLGARLARAGITVLAVDCLGFGRSRLSQGEPRIEDYAAAPTLRAALRSLREHACVDAERVGLMGHSFGGSLALRAARVEAGVRFAVAIGPTRRVAERYVSPESGDLLWLRERLVCRRGRAPKPSLDFVRTLLREVALEYSLCFWSGPDHPPVLLLDGGDESPADLAALGRLAGDLSPTAAHRRIGRADHYLNVGGFGPLLSYDRRAVEEAISSICSWIERSTTDGWCVQGVGEAL